MPPRSKIAQIPPEVRKWLHSTFVDRAFGDIQAITEELQAKLQEAGIAVYIGKSAVGAESLRVKRAQEAIRATTEAARLISEASADSTDARSEAIMGLVQSETFDLMLELREATDEKNPEKRLKLMANVAKAVSTLSRARVNQARYREEVERRAKAAAEEVAKLATSGGLSAEQVSTIRASILGIVKRDAP